MLLAPQPVVISGTIIEIVITIKIKRGFLSAFILLSVKK